MIEFPSDNEFINWRTNWFYIRNIRQENRHVFIASPTGGNSMIYWTSTGNRQRASVCDFLYILSMKQIHSLCYWMQSCCIWFCFKEIAAYNKTFPAVKNKRPTKGCCWHETFRRKFKALKSVSALFIYMPLRNILGEQWRECFVAPNRDYSLELNVGVTLIPWMMDEPYLTVTTSTLVFFRRIETWIGNF